MQLHLKFEGDQLNLPISYQSILQGMIYRALQSEDAGLSARLHEKGRQLGVDSPKLFVFGRLLGPYRIRQRNILFPEGAALEIRSPDPQLIRTLAAGLREGTELPLGHNTVRLTSCRTADLRIAAERMHVRTVSPFAVHTDYENRKCFAPEKMRLQLIENARRKWCGFGKDPAAFALELRWGDVPPVPVHTVFKGICVDAWSGSMTLAGSSEVLDLLYQTGLGARNSQGFGLIDSFPEPGLSSE